MSQLDFLKFIDTRTMRSKKDVEIYPNVYISVYDNIKYDTPLNRENLLTEIYDKLYLSHPLTYEQKQIIGSAEDIEKGGYAFSPSGFTIEAPRTGRKVKKIVSGLKKKKR